MWWLTLRLQRAELILLLVLALAVGALYATTHDGIRAVIDQPAAALMPGGCAETAVYLAEGAYCPTGFDRLLPVASEAVPLGLFVPIGLAVVTAFGPIGEVAGRSQRLAWTQSRTRRAWVRSRLGVPLAVTVLGAVAVTVLARWWLPYRPVMDSVRGYDLQGVVGVAWAVLAVGLVLAAATVVRRPVVALLLAAVAWVAGRMLFMQSVRPWLVPPDRVETSSTDSTTWTVQGWVVRTWYERADGSRVGEFDVSDLCADRGFARGPLETCLTAEGLDTRVWQVHPDAHYWPLQWVEVGLVTAAGLALLGWVAWYWSRRLE